jgi:hypothetical protein
MKRGRFLLTLALLATILWTRAGTAQHPTAARDLELSAFGAVSVVFTGLDGGKNFSLTAGGDLALPPYHWVRPVIEVRGTFPTDHGLIDSQKSVLAGLRFDFLLGHRIHPYGDFLFGRGQINYGYGYIYGDEIYDLTTTYIDSPGAGFDYDLSDQLSVKVDGQFQRWASAPTPSGVIYSKAGTVGLVYRFGFERHGRR